MIIISSLHKKKGIILQQISCFLNTLKIKKQDTSSAANIAEKSEPEREMSFSFSFPSFLPKHLAHKQSITFLCGWMCKKEAPTRYLVYIYCSLHYGKFFELYCLLQYVCMYLPTSSCNLARFNAATCFFFFGFVCKALNCSLLYKHIANWVKNVHSRF